MVEINEILLNKIHRVIKSIHFLCCDDDNCVLISLIGDIDADFLEIDNLTLLVVEMSSDAGIEGTLGGVCEGLIEILCPFALCFNNINPDNLFVNKYSKVTTSTASHTSISKYA